jgi:hypothetical protein
MQRKENEITGFAAKRAAHKEQNFNLQVKNEKIFSYHAIQIRARTLKRVFSHALSIWRLRTLVHARFFLRIKFKLLRRENNNRAVCYCVDVESFRELVMFYVFVC